MQEGKQKDPGKPTEASLAWIPNAQKCRDRESNPGLIGANWEKIRYTILLPLDPMIALLSMEGQAEGQLLYI